MISLLNFMEAYSCYNQIRKNLMNAPKITFMSFDLKNTWATCQMLMYIAFSSYIERNLEVYSDEMVIKTPEDMNHVKDMEETFESIRNLT